MPDQSQPTPDKADDEVEEEAREAVDIPPGSTPETAQRRSSKQNLEEAKDDPRHKGN